MINSRDQLWMILTVFVVKKKNPILNINYGKNLRKIYAFTV